MSGHSKWATIKRKKAAIDSKRAKMFAKYIKQIEMCARTGGADPDGNPALHEAVAKAKKNSVPADNIDRAIRRGAGLDSGGAAYETIMYEGYGPGGVAFMIECLSDNKNRAASEVRVAVTRNGGNMADPGSVAYMFHRKGIVTLPKSAQATEDAIMEAALEFGLEAVNDLGESWQVVSEPSDLMPVRNALQAAGLEYDEADISFIPSITVPVDGPTAVKLFELIDAIEDLDDVQNVFANFDVSDEVMASLG